MSDWIVVESDQYPFFNPNTGETAGMTTKVATIFDPKTKKFMEIPYPEPETNPKEDDAATDNQTPAAK